LIPVVLDSQIERTGAVIADLRQLADLPDENIRNEMIWFCGFLSVFATSDGPHHYEADVRDLFLQERDLLVHLARRGCHIRCMLAPPLKSTQSDSKGFVGIRLKALIAFISSGDSALSNWVRH
jgi:hypothetical protein